MRLALAVLAILAPVARAGGPTTKPTAQPNTWAPAAQLVPEGCPIHLVAPHDAVPKSFELHAVRGRREVVQRKPTGGVEVVLRPAGHAVAIRVAATVEASVTVDHDYMNWDANCAPIRDHDVLDRVTLRLTGARAGDVIEGVDGVWWTKLTVAPPGRCPAVEWPADIAWHASACDMMPVSPSASH